jgi:hypothetical protein
VQLAFVPSGIVVFSGRERGEEGKLPLCIARTHSSLPELLCARELERIIESFERTKLLGIEVM